MNRLIKIISFALVVGSISLVSPARSNAQTAVNFQVFYNDLSPHGTWFQSPDYGYVWRPRLTNFAPYSTNGYWAYTSAGWTWVSDYSWGWAPFHYGRWYNDPFYGYVWVPGYEWGPGWVTWRQSADYYGWAPIGPGVGLNIAYGNGYQLPYSYWNFVPCNRFGRSDLHNYYIDRSRNTTIINNTTVINTRHTDPVRNTTYTPGPDRAEVQTKLGSPVKQLAIVDESQPTQKVTKNAVRLYRPVVKEETAAIKPAPARVESMSTLNEKISNDRKGNLPATTPATAEAAPTASEKARAVNDDERATPRARRQIREAQVPVRESAVTPGQVESSPSPVKQSPPIETRTTPVTRDQPAPRRVSPGEGSPRTTAPARVEQRADQTPSRPPVVPERRITQPIERRSQPDRQMMPQRQAPQRPQMQQAPRQAPVQAPPRVAPDRTRGMRNPN